MFRRNCEWNKLFYIMVVPISGFLPNMVWGTKNMTMGKAFILPESSNEKTENKNTTIEIKPFKIYNYMYINHYK